MSFEDSSDSSLSYEGEEIGHTYVRNQFVNRDSGWSTGDLEDNHHRIDHHHYKHSGDQVDVSDHIQKGEYSKNEQSVTLVAEIKGTLADFDKNPELTVWKPSGADLLAMMKNNKVTDRNNASASDRSGDLKTVVMVGLEHLCDNNTQHKSMAVHVHDVEGKAITGYRPCVVTLEAMHAQTTPLGNVFQPNKVFTNQMNKDLSENRIINYKDDVTVHENKLYDSVIAGPLWDYILQCSDEGRWVGSEDHLDQENSVERRMYQIPKTISNDLKKEYEGLNDKKEQRVTNMEKFHVTFKPKDGSNWCDGVGDGLISKEDRINKYGRTFVKFRLTYLVPIQ